jgi:murein DD-endopeptidase MepM/ murein hydrolase activator NlpD
MIGGCLDPGNEVADTSSTAQPSIVQIGWIPQNGTTVAFDDITSSNLNLNSVTDITACDATALYATIGTNLYFSNNSGQSWTYEGVVHGPRIACDHAQLANLDASGQLWMSPLWANGNLAHDPTTQVLQWVSSPGLSMTRIQGGDGTFYGTRPSGAGYDVYVASNLSWQVKPVWSSSPIAHIGAIQVTGTGATHTGSDNAAVSGSIAWPRMAFALEASGTIDTNSLLLSGNNGWGAMNTGGERYTTLTAAAPNLLFGLESKPDGTHLGRIRITETSCFDGVDNDHNGLVDSEDPACVQAVANNFCATKSDGTYCSSRYQPSVFLGQWNQLTSLTHCIAGSATVTPGSCVINPNASNADYLRTKESSVQPEQPGQGHYCNVHYPDGSWDFDWTGATPCNNLALKHPGVTPTIVRAGQYSPTGTNNVYVKCTDGSWGPGVTTGVAPLQQAYNQVGHGTNKCVFMVSPAALPMFDKMLDGQLPYPERSAGPFVHNQSPVDYAQFGLGEPTPLPSQNGIDRMGHGVGPREKAYDVDVDEGWPLYAPATGTVMTSGGSRVRDITFDNTTGTPNQDELYVEYSVGTDPTYRETFLVYYAHMRRRMVVDGQTVKSGQIIGYVGASGATGGVAHVHIGVMRETNTNAHTAANLAFGYHQATFPSLAPSAQNTGLNNGGANSTDPLGWGNGGIDPWGYWDWDTNTGYGYNGLGAWSPVLFKPAAGFHYP